MYKYIFICIYIYIIHGCAKETEDNRQYRRINDERRLVSYYYHFVVGGFIDLFADFQQF